MVEMKDSSTADNALGSLLRAHRKKLRLTLQQVAEQAGIYKSTLLRMETGATPRPDVKTLYKLSQILEADISELHAASGLPRPALPSLRTYFRRKLGVDAAEADVLAELIAEHQRAQREEDTNEEHR